MLKYNLVMPRIKRKVTVPLFSTRKTTAGYIKSNLNQSLVFLENQHHSHKFYINKFQYQYPAQPVMAIVSHFPPPPLPSKVAIRCLVDLPSKMSWSKLDFFSAATSDIFQKACR